MISAQKAREIVLNDRTGYAKKISAVIRKAAMQGLTTVNVLGAVVGVPNLATQTKLKDEFESLGYAVTLNKSVDVLTSMDLTWTTPVSLVGTGYTGSVGAVGYSGSVGTGYSGSVGGTGYSGSVGGTGYTGSEGTGYTGSQGEIGYTGSAGL